MAEGTRAKQRASDFPTRVILSCFARDSLKHVRQVAPSVGNAGLHRVSAAFKSDHRPEVDSRDAIWTAQGLASHESRE